MASRKIAGIFENPDAAEHAKEKLLEAGARLAMWIGGLPAVEASFRIQRAISEYEREGLGSLSVWLPEGEAR